MPKKKACLSGIPGLYQKAHVDCAIFYTVRAFRALQPDKQVKEIVITVLDSLQLDMSVEHAQTIYSDMQLAYMQNKGI